MSYDPQEILFTVLSASYPPLKLSIFKAEPLIYKEVRVLDAAIGYQGQWH